MRREILHMIEYKDQKIDFDKLEIKDIIDVHVLQSFLDNFAIAVNARVPRGS